MTTMTEQDELLDANQGLQQAFDKDNVGLRVINIQSVIPNNWDNVSVTYNALNDVYAFKIGSTTIGSIVVTYTDLTKAAISTVARV